MTNEYNRYLFNLSNLYIIRFLLDQGYLSQRVKFNLKDTNISTATFAMKKIAKKYALSNPDVFYSIVIKGKIPNSFMLQTKNVKKDLSSLISVYQALDDSKKAEALKNLQFAKFYKAYNRLVKIADSNLFMSNKSYLLTFPYSRYQNYSSSTFITRFNKRVLINDPFRAVLHLIELLNYTILYFDLCNQTSFLNHMGLSLKS